MKLTDSHRYGLNRFLASVHIDGREEYAHIPNSGQMRELLTTGRQVKLGERRSQRRKTRYDLSLVNYTGRWVSVDARLPGILFVESIGKRQFPEFAEYFIIKREVTHRSSRIGVIL